jgi:hypothetical protein
MWMNNLAAKIRVTAEHAGCEQLGYESGGWWSSSQRRSSLTTQLSRGQLSTLSPHWQWHTGRARRALLCLICP